MYPKPVKLDLSPKWLGGITKLAKQGFNIYNMVKKFIPGGTVAGAGPVPGSGDEMEELIELFEMPDGFEEVAGMGMKLLEQIDKTDKDAEKAFEARL